MNMFKSHSSQNIGGDFARSLGNSLVEKRRGFKPSDCHDLNKRQFLMKLSQQIWQKSNETSNVKKRIDLQKIFTPATDAEEILPKNRKLYASSAFYSPTLHPTVEDQVELARRISHSLSDISNQQSKGQSMYVNRKKRSVKWVHEGSGKDSASHGYEYEEESKENTEYNHDASEYNTGITTTSSSGTKTDGQMAPLAKVPLKLVMNPRGQIRDFNTEREALNTETGLMSPDKCAELVTALNTQKGKGAELFAKRRRKAEKWVVDETNAGTQSPSGLPDYHQYQPKPPTSPSILPAYSDAGKHRVQLNMHQEQLIEKYAKPGLKVVKTPWEAALETGSASAAFVEEHKLWPYSTQPTSTISPGPIPQYGYNRGASPSAGDVTDSGPSNYAPQNGQKLPQTQMQPPKQSNFNSQRDLAYKPNIPQGWKAPSVALPKDFEFHMLTKEFQKQELKFQEQQTFQGPQTFQEQETFQEQHMLQQISDAAKSCEAFTNKDEEELIRFIERSRLEPPRFHDLNSHMVRSPELSVSQISKENLLLYDNTVQEFENQLQKQLKPETHMPTPIVQDDGSKADGFHRKNGHHLIVNVGRQLQQFEEYQQLVRIQQRQEEQLVQKRVAQQRERERERELHLREKRRQDGDVFPATVTIAAKQQQSETHVQEPKRLTGSVAEDQLEYVKVAVRDLISSFEQQAQTEAEKLTKEQNTLQYWKERRQQAANKQSARKQQQKEPEQQLLNAAKQLQCQQAQEWELQKQQELQQYEQQRFQYQQQTQQQKEHDRTEQQLHHHTESGHRSSSSQYNGAADHRQAITTATPELYVPKEIPLESYAAPPVASSSLYSIPATSPISWSPAQASAFTPAHIVEGPGPKPQSYSSVVSAQVPAQSSFPLSKPLGDGGFGFCSNSHYTPPKQPHLPPNSYQTLQQGITPAPAVNFSPSPLPYDKLAKFENYSESMSPPIQSSSPHYRPLAVPGAGSKVRNLSPVPYGVRPTLAASQSLPPQPVSGYGRPGSSRPPSQQYGAPYAVGGHENSSLSPRAHVAADLSHCQNFNNAARGWGAGGNRASFGGSCRNVKPLPVTANLPYTDF